ncbi:MAG: hypothetical protein RLZZ461_737 [Planctomycetota bacterium]
MTSETRTRHQRGSDSSASPPRWIGRVRRIVRLDGPRSGPVLDSTPGESTLSSHPSNPEDSAEPFMRCVMLVSPGQRPPQPVLDLLRNRSARPEHLIVVEHPLIAAARLARLERDRQIRTENLEGEWPPRKPEKTILAVVNRDERQDLSQLFSTIRTHLPAVGIWVCSERITLEIYVGEEEEPQPQVHGSTASTSPAAADSDSTEIDASTPPTKEIPAREVDLTEAELQDLLAHFDAFEDVDDLDGLDVDDDLLPPGPGGSAPS